MQIAIGIFVVLLFLFALLFVPARIRVRFSYVGNAADFSVSVGLGVVQFNITPLLSKKKSNPPKETPEEKPKEKPKEKFSFAKLEEAISKGVDMLQYLRKKITVKLFSLKVRMGLGDAADTGLATGAGYAAIYNILGTIDRFFVLKKHAVVITPVFSGRGFEAEFQGTFQLRLLYCLGLLYKIRMEDVL